jgi:hypothetical protein
MRPSHAPGGWKSRTLNAYNVSGELALRQIKGLLGEAAVQASLRSGSDRQSDPELPVTPDWQSS